MNTMDPASYHEKGKADDKIVHDVESLSKISSEAVVSDGDTATGGVNIRKVGWKHATFCMMKTQVGIGVLGIPGAFHSVGLIPGLLTLLGAAGVMTWSNYQIGCFKRRHQSCYSLEDAAFIMFGRCGRLMTRIIFLGYWIFVTGSAFVTLGAAFSTFADDKVCKAIFVGVSAIIGWMLCSVKDLQKVSNCAIPAMVCIIVSVLLLTGSVAMQSRPSAAPPTGPWQSDWKLVGNTTFADTMYAISTMIFAFSGTPAFFQIEAEMKDPEHYNRAMLTCQAIVTTIYTIVGTVVYYYCGSYVSSPALGSAGDRMKTICYAIAVPGLLVSTMIVAHIPAKDVFVHTMYSRERWHRHLNIDNPWAKVAWLSCTGLISLPAYLIASTIPGFGSLVSLIGAVFGVPISIILYPLMWFFDNLPMEPLNTQVDKPDIQLRQRWAGRSLRWSERAWQWKLSAAVKGFVFVGGIFCMIGGTYGSVLAMMAALAAGVSKPFSCAA